MFYNLDVFLLAAIVAAVILAVDQIAHRSTPQTYQFSRSEHDAH